MKFSAHWLSYFAAAENELTNDAEHSEDGKDAQHGVLQNNYSS